MARARPVRTARPRPGPGRRAHREQGRRPDPLPRPPPLRRGLTAYHAGEISYGEFDSSVQGWINHVGHADSWGLRRHVLDTLPARPAEHRRAVAARQNANA